MSLVLPSGLTAAQAAIWLDQHLFAGKPIYNTGQFLTIRGKLDVDLFETALRQAVAESPGLRLAPHFAPDGDIGGAEVRHVDSVGDMQFPFCIHRCFLLGQHRFGEDHFRPLADGILCY